MQITNKKPSVAFFLRKSRAVGNYSIEFIFDDVRARLKDKAECTFNYSGYESSGFFKRLYNCVQAAFRQKQVNHVTGDIHYIGIFLNKRKTVHTIHDCVFLDRSIGFKHKLLKLFWVTIPVRNSVFITAISESTKKEILKYSNCDPQKIIVIPVAISERFRKSNKVFNKTKPVILQIGTAPNKNLPRLIRALQNIRCELHIVGKFEKEYEQQLIKYGIDYNYQSGLTEDEIIAKYKEADIISFASTYEGFGMPILEGQATGRVVVTSNIFSMPEVAGDAACFVDPFSEQSIRQGILKVIEDDGYREQLIYKGYENIKRFQPDRIANLYFDLYLTIANQTN